MATILQREVNCIFFPKGNYTGGKVTGVTNAEVSVVGTKNFIFIVPKREVSSILIATKIKSFSFGHGVSVEQGLENLLNNPQMTVEQLEGDLKDFLGAENHDRVIEVAQLKSFKVHLMWILSQARMSHKEGRAVKVLSLGKPSNMKKFKEFYFPA